MLRTTTSEVTQFIVILAIPFLILLLLVVCLGYFLFKRKSKNQLNVLDFLQLAQTDFFEAAHAKLIVGLQNVGTELIAEPIRNSSPDSLAIAEPIFALKTTRSKSLEVVDQAGFANHFPPSIRDDLKSGMKGRTVLTLIEIACQYPEEINPTQLSQTLDIPPTSISDEIKRLIDLKYIEPYLSAKTLQDGRYRYYSITTRGSEFLNFLKGILELAINQMKAID
ncbi:MAG: winged helix-turn-helix domain-containing protein [Candidatus Heimdallarchaeota archaeon]